MVMYASGSDPAMVTVVPEALRRMVPLFPLPSRVTVVVVVPP
jgi:hypothetical protein